MADRGRPRGRWTPRRRQVYEACVGEIATAGRVCLAQVARQCGLTDYRNARRIVTDLHRLGWLPA